ncbi:MAG: radical SAM protein [Lachnospiraceae bacterium]|nr:radical SAM protein [Lachnospiraceae bacterium]
MQDKELRLLKLTYLITMQCNLNCKLCTEDIARFRKENRMLPNLTVAQLDELLEASFDVVDSVKLLHLSGGEPFVHKDLAEMIDHTMRYADRFDNLMVFTNGTIPMRQELYDVFKKYGNKIILHATDYGFYSDKFERLMEQVKDTGIIIRRRHYHEDEAEFGGWVDLGDYECHGRSEEEKEAVFAACGIVKDMKGNWRTRDGKLHWCSRSLCGTEQGLIPSVANKDYVDLLDKNMTREEKREAIRNLMKVKTIEACNYCSGDFGTTDMSKRHRPAEQEEM